MNFPSAHASPRVHQPSTASARSRATRVLVAALLTLLTVFAAASLLGPTAARAVDDDVVAIADADLKAMINSWIAGGHAPDQDVTDAEARTVTTIANTHIAGPITDLAGIERVRSADAPFAWRSGWSTTRVAGWRRRRRPFVCPRRCARRGSGR